MLRGAATPTCAREVFVGARLARAAVEQPGPVVSLHVLDTGGQTRLMRLGGLRRALQATRYGGQQNPPEPVKFL